MFWLISEPQATLPGITELLFKKKKQQTCLNSHLQTTQPENLQLCLLTDILQYIEFLFVWGFQGVVFLWVFLSLCFANRAALGTSCAGRGAERKLAALLFWRKYQFLSSHL